jgi:hypothetical protein
MSVWDPFIKPEATHDKRVSAANTLLIANTDQAISIQAADWYQARRGIGHRIDMALGATNSNVPIGHPIVSAVSDYLQQHRIECIIASADCPYLLGSSEFSAKLAALSGSYNPWSFNSVLWPGHTPVVSSAGGVPYVRPTGYTQLENPFNPVLAPDGKGRHVIQEIDTWNLKTTEHYPVRIAHGQLGFVWNYASPRLNTLSTIQRCVEDCIWAEQQPLTGKKLALGFGTYTADGSKEAQWYAWQIAKAAGLTVGYYYRDAALGIDKNAWLGQDPDCLEADFFAGSAAMAGDVYLGSAVINLPAYSNATPNPYHNSLHPNRGAWAFNWCSAGNLLVENLIYHGGAAGIGPAFEPFVSGLADDASVLSLALKGYSLAEVAFYAAQGGFAFTAWGDPLYRPFPIHGLPDGEVSSVTPVAHSAILHNSSSSRHAVHGGPTGTIHPATPIRTALWRN